MGDLITIRNLYKVFITETGQEVKALEDINLTVGEDDFVCVIGPSGSGKSTLLRLMEGLLPPTAGEIRAMGKVVTRPLPEASMVFQEYSLMPWRKIIDNVAFGLEVRGVPKKRRHEIASNILRRFGLRDFMFSYPYELSGGMQQRAAIARALATSPLILFMDEPFGALDAFTRFQMQQELMEFWLEETRAVVFVTHSVEEAIYLGKRVVLMSPRPGKIAQEYHIDLPYPRDRFDSNFRSYFEQIMDHMNRVNEK
ncbi:MAG: ABC transporter ATP-binding protein [Clostridia bacterium]|jgi:NitT/TauT family transport system ATP-binding protein|nr:ABC transporter ATP-binding protein [Clostridia bacterium]